MRKKFITPPFVAGCVAAILACIKLVFGIASGSVAVISSALDSLGDCLISAMNFFALKKAAAQPNSKFNFGYGKLESLVALFEGIFIAGVGFFVAYCGVMKLLNPEEIEFESAFGVMIVSMILTAFLVIYLRKASAKNDSMIIFADALHYEVDLITNAATIAALVAVHFSGLVIIDALFGIAVSAYIVFRAVPLIRDSIYMLLDVSLPEHITKEVLQMIQESDEVLSSHFVRTRKSGEICYFSAHLVFDPFISLAKAHEAEAELERKVREKFPQNKWIFEIHFDISDDSQNERIDEFRF